MSPRRRPVLALDIGGTKMAGGLVDPGGRVSGTKRVKTPQGRRADEAALWRTVERLVADVVGDVQVAGVGVGCGGPMTWPAGEVSPLNIPGWQDFPLRERLSGLFPHAPVHLHNDAVCFAVGEHWRGAGRGVPNILGMVVSTGVGGGLVLGDRLVNGASGNGGHIGHVVVDPEGPECSCGGRGCLEAVASGPRLARWAQDQGWQGGRDSSAMALAADARRGHEVALRAMDRAGTALGIAIASATHLCDLDVVAVGGGLSQAGPMLFDPLERAFRRHARMAFTRDVRVVPAALGLDAGLVGAGALVLAGDRYWSG